MWVSFSKKLVNVGRLIYIFGLALSLIVLIYLTVFALMLEGFKPYFILGTVNLLIVFLLIVVQMYFLYTLRGFRFYARIWSSLVLVFFILGMPFTIWMYLSQIPPRFLDVLIGAAFGLAGSIMVLLSTVRFRRVLVIAGFFSMMLSWLCLTSNLLPLGYYWEVLDLPLPIPGTFCSYPALHLVMYLIEIATGLSIATLSIGIIYSTLFGSWDPEFPDGGKGSTLFFALSSTVILIALILIAHSGPISIAIIKDNIGQNHPIPLLLDGKQILAFPSIFRFALSSVELAYMAAIIMIIGSASIAAGNIISLIRSK